MQGNQHGRNNRLGVSEESLIHPGMKLKLDICCDNPSDKFLNLMKSRLVTPRPPMKRKDRDNAVDLCLSSDDQPSLCTSNLSFLTHANIENNDCVHDDDLDMKIVDMYGRVMKRLKRALTKVIKEGRNKPTNGFQGEKKRLKRVLKQLEESLTNQTHIRDMKSVTNDGMDLIALPVPSSQEVFKLMTIYHDDEE